MIIESVLNALKAVITSVFSWINIPGIGKDFETAMSYIDLLFQNAQSLINLFLPWKIVTFGIPIIIIVENFEHIYHFVIWILKKIPMLGIE